MRALLITLVTLLLATSVRCSDADRKPLDEEFLRNYMAGEYDLIGRKADSSATYKGRVTLRGEGGVIEVTRTVENKTDKMHCSIRYRSGQRSHSGVKNAFSF